MVAGCWRWDQPPLGLAPIEVAPSFVCLTSQLPSCLGFGDFRELPALGSSVGTVSWTRVQSRLSSSRALASIAPCLSLPHPGLNTARPSAHPSCLPAAYLKDSGGTVGLLNTHSCCIYSSPGQLKAQSPTMPWPVGQWQVLDRGADWWSQ